MTSLASLADALLPHLEVVLEAAPKWDLLVRVLGEVQAKRAEWRAAGRAPHRPAGGTDAAEEAAEQPVVDGTPPGKMVVGGIGNVMDDDDDDVQIVEPPLLCRGGSPDPSGRGGLQPEGPCIGETKLPPSQGHCVETLLHALSGRRHGSTPSPLILPLLFQRRPP